MRRHKVDSQRERRLLAALVVSKRFLAQASRVFSSEPSLDLLRSEPLRVVARWCLDYYEQYRKAPGVQIESIYHKWAEDSDNQELVSAVRDFLESLSEQYDREGELNVPYLVDDLGDFVNRGRLLLLKDSLEFSLAQGKTKDAEEALASFRQVRTGSGVGDVMADKEGWKQAFSDPSSPIVTFEGDAGRFFNSAFTRDSLVGVQAPEKTGKTFWCVEFVMRALRQRRKVALFEVGDLSKSQVYKRLGVRLTGRPMWHNQTERPIRVPTEIHIDEAEEVSYSVEYEHVRRRSTVSLPAVKESMEKFGRGVGWAKDTSYLFASVHPTKTLSVQGIKGILDQWQEEHNFIADVVVVDYADILAPERSLKDARHQVDETWAALRRLSQERHALVIAPTQANASTYAMARDRVQTMSNFSEDKRKLAHVTAMLALNQSPAEKDMQGMRLNWLVLREAPFSTYRPLYVGTCFALGRALCCAKFPDRDSSPKEE